MQICLRFTKWFEMISGVCGTEPSQRSIGNSSVQSLLHSATVASRNVPRLALGISLGGASAVLASPALEVDALVLESVYRDIETAIGNRIGARIPGGALLTPLLSWQIKPRAGVSASWLNPALRAQTIDVPALVLSGTEDTQTTVEDTYKLFNALAGVKRLHFFEGAAHVNLYRYDAQQYKQVVLAFLDTHLLFR